MKVHANAKLGPTGRLVMVKRVVDEGWSLAEAAAAAGTSERTASKWVGRHRAEGEAGLEDRSSAPRSVPHRTVGAVLDRIGLGKLSRPGAAQPLRARAPGRAAPSTSRSWCGSSAGRVTG